jgi:hypothetical protein
MGNSLSNIRKHQILWSMMLVQEKRQSQAKAMAIPFDGGI